MLDKKTFTIGILALSAAILIVANILAPSPATASYNTIADRNFQIQTATAVGGGDAIYITDSSNGMMAVATYNPTTHKLELQDAKPVQNAFSSVIKK